MMHFRLFAILLLLVAGSTTVVSGQTQQEPALDMEFTDIPLSEAISRIEKNLSLIHISEPTRRS